MNRKDRRRINQWLSENREYIEESSFNQSDLTVRLAELPERLRVEAIKAIRNSYH